MHPWDSTVVVPSDPCFCHSFPCVILFSWTWAGPSNTSYKLNKVKMTRCCFQKQVTEDSSFCLSLFLLLSPLLAFPGVGNGNPLQYSWGIPWTQETGGYGLWSSKEWDTTEWLTYLLILRKVTCHVGSDLWRGPCDKKVLSPANSHMNHEWAWELPILLLENLEMTAGQGTLDYNLVRDSEPEIPH